jgi:hypothetical protein
LFEKKEFQVTSSINMNEIYHYNKIFFRRPLLTSDNLRLLSITMVVAIMIGIILLLSMNWAKTLPSYILNQTIAVKYISFLSEEKEKFQTTETEISASNPNFIRSSDEMLIENKILPDGVRSNFRNYSKESTAASIKLEPLQKQQAEEDSSLYTLGDKPGELVNSAISKIPGPIVGVSTIEKGEQALNFVGEEEYIIQFKESIQIPRPKFVRVASTNGNRNPDETFAILENNEIDVKHCFEKYSRYDPTFSGDIKVSFTIHPDGYVIPSSIRILNSNITDTRIISCIKITIQRWKNFPSIAIEDGIFTITRKYIF